MLEHTLAEAAAAAIGPVELCTDPGPGQSVWDPYRAFADQLCAQGKGDLGVRLARAAEHAINKGERALLIGSDCPGLDRERLRDCAERLDDHDAVLLPASDGGYVLLGLRRFDPSLFTGIAWSSAKVAEQSIDRIRQLGWSLHIGEMLHDVDEPADLDRASHLLPQTLEFRPARPSLRSLVPVAYLGLILAALLLVQFFGSAELSLLGLSGMIVLVAGGAWLTTRLRFPGDPRLRVGPDELVYRRGKRERRLSWEAVKAIEVHHRREEMRFISRSGERITTHRDMVTADGRRFDMLIEHYWLP